MRKQITLTIDSDVYDELQDLPRRVSVSEVASWALKMYIAEFKKGREMTQEEFNEFFKWTPGGQDFKKRFKQDPTMKAVGKVVNLDETVADAIVKVVKRKVGRPPKPKV